MASRKNILEVIRQFPFFQRLSQKAIRAAERDGEGDELTQRLQEWSTFTRAYWLKNIVQLRDTLVQFSARRAFSCHPNNFKLLENDAKHVMQDMTAFCEWDVANNWPLDDENFSVKEYQQLTIDAFDIMLKQTFQRAVYLGQWTQSLSSLCRTLEKLPSTLQVDISLLQFTEADAFAFGGHGWLFKARLLDKASGGGTEGRLVAVKFMRHLFDGHPCETSWTKLHHEALNLLNLDLSCLNPFIGVTTDPQRGLGLVAPYLERGNAVDFLLKREASTSDRVIWVCTIFPIIVSAVHQLHYVHLSHGDIKGANILIDDDEKPCLTDFGLARVSAQQLSGSGNKLNSETGSYAYTPRFCSPERIQSPCNFTPDSDDVWALGMTIVQLLTGQQPFPELCEPEFLMKLYSGVLTLKRAHVPIEVPDDLWELIKCCTEVDTGKRWPALRACMVIQSISGRYALEGLSLSSTKLGQQQR